MVIDGPTSRPLAGYIPITEVNGVRAVGQLYDYLFATNGVFISASRPELEVCLSLATCEIRGLVEISEFVKFSRPRVPAVYLTKMLELSVAACVEKGEPTEALFHLLWNANEDRWRLDKPAQEATGGSVRPIDAGAGSSYELAIIELHSHHSMPAFFSGTDDQDEQGFRLYAVIGEIFSEPKIRVRIGCYGHFLEIPAEQVFELPEGILDGHEEDELVETR